MCFSSHSSFKWTFKIFHVLSLQLISSIYSIFVHCRAVVGKIPAFQSGGPGSIPDGVRNFNFYSGTGCLPFVLSPILSPAVALTLYWQHIQGSPPLGICLLFWSTEYYSSYRHLNRRHLGCKSRGVRPTFGESKYQRKKYIYSIYIQKLNLYDKYVIYNICDINFMNGMLYLYFVFW